MSGRGFEGGVMTATRMFTRRELLEDARHSVSLENAARIAREMVLPVDRAKQEQQAWSEVGEKSVGAEK
jgi:hypothetical protein